MAIPSYFAVLGRQPELGLIELESILGGDRVHVLGRHALLDELPASIDHLGGTIKLGRLLTRLEETDANQLIERLDLASFPLPEGKLQMGLSWYGPGADARKIKELGLALKRRLRELGRSVRYVAPMDGETSLNAAQFTHNHLGTSGFELAVFAYGHDLFLGIVTAVQDVDAYAKRDHGRPARSAKVGMLPPKLAQILVNTTHAKRIYDPFCGTGVILQEAALMGRPVGGSDIAPEMVEATVTNLTWLSEQDLSTLGAIEAISRADARSVRIPPGEVAIVSEGYLGPNLTHAPSRSELDRLASDLLPLYRDTLANLAPQLATGSELALCAPAWRVDGSWTPLPIVDEVGSLGYTTKVFETVPATQQTPLVYGRSDQSVGRALILLTKV